MIRHILRLIWNQRWQNGWLWAEFLLVSVCLWALVDYLYVMGSTRAAPLGFDIEHTYRISMDDLSDSASDYLPKDAREEGDTDGALLLDLLDRMRAYPGVEAVGCSDVGMPYTLGYRSLMWRLDTLDFHCRYMMVSPDYFKVFRVKGQEGDYERLATAFREAGETGVIVSSDVGADGEGFRPALGQRVTCPYMEGWEGNLVGICRPVRRSEYERAEPVLFRPLTDAKLAAGRYDGSMSSLEVCFRVRPEADGADFAARFREEMAKQARVGNIYLLDVTPISADREGYIRIEGKEDTMRDSVAIGLFLLANIFLGIIGTFWLRTEHRKGEMGLRMALGSTRRQLNAILVGEGVLLLVLAFIPSAIISFNIAHMGLIETYLQPFTVARFLICEGITFALIILMILCGVWYPARSAARLEPAEALRYE